MRRRITDIESRALPRDRVDLIRQLMLFAAAYGLYEIVRGIVGTDGRRPFTNATRIIDLERSLHVFAEPRIEAWVTVHAHWLLDLAAWTYLNAHFTLTVGALAFIYLRRNDSFYFVRNMFMVAMLIALVGYTVYPTAPPRLMPTWGFTDAVQQFSGVTLQHGVAGVLLNPYAAVPSMHVCVALMIGLPMSRLVRSRLLGAIWLTYPVFIGFVVVATGNHYFTDVVLGGLTATVSALVAERLLARARPESWAFHPVSVEDPAGIALNRVPA